MSVIIVGAGPTGLAAALCLCEWSIPFRIIDEGTHRKFCSKGYILTSRTMEIFCTLGIEKRILALTTQKEKCQLFINGLKNCDIPCADDSLSDFGHLHILPQPTLEYELEKILNEKAGQQVVEKGCELMWLQDEGTNVKVLIKKNNKEETVKCRFLFACDGHHSRIRKLIGINYDGSNSKKRTGVLDAQYLETTIPNPQELSIFVKDQGVLFYSPTAKGSIRITTVFNYKNEDKLGSFKRSVKKLLAPFSIKFSEKDICFSHYHVSERIASVFVKGNCMLLGDSAHTFYPILGNSINTGIQDAFNLVWKIGFILKHDSPIHPLLTSYDQERKCEALNVYKESRNISIFLGVDPGFFGSIIRLLLPYLTSNSRFKKWVVKNFHQISIRYVSSASLLNHALCGKILPHVIVKKYEETVERSLFSIVYLSYHHYVLMFVAPDEGSASLLFQEYQAIKDSIRSTVMFLSLLMVISVRPTEAFPLAVLIDEKQELMRKAGETEPFFMLIRPDHYIAAVEKDLRALLLFSESVLKHPAPTKK